MSTETPSRISIWTFDEAAPELRQLHHGPNQPTWIATVPRDIYASDIEEVFIRQSKTDDVSKYEVESGPVVFMGSSSLLGVVEKLAQREAAGRLPHASSAT